jgi:hypothetical protein
VLGDRRFMDRRAGVGLAAYAVLIASLATPLYDPLFSGDDEWWALPGLLVFAHLGLGAAVGRWWVLAVPVVASLGFFLQGGAEALAWLWVFVGAPLLLLITGIGLAFRRVRWIPAVLFAVAALPTAWAAAETAERGEHVPASLERQLPLDVSLGNLCPGAESDRAFIRDLRRQTDVMIRELERRPDDLVTYTYYYSDEPEERRDITVRELAEEQLADLEAGGRNCAPELQRRIREAL